MKTLVIHPKDSSTSFLDVVYNSIENKTVIDGGINKTTLMELIKSHDRIMMMGHGSPQGLFSVGKFPDTYPFIIDEDIETSLYYTAEIYSDSYIEIIDKKVVDADIKEQEKIVSQIETVLNETHRLQAVYQQKLADL
jgi:hypothetical protein